METYIVTQEVINIEQLLEIHSALKIFLTYMQRPFGAGETIIESIVTVFFNEKIILEKTYN